MAEDPCTSLSGSMGANRNLRGLRLVLPEGEDGRILQAARVLLDRHGIEVILLGEPDVLARAAKEAGVTLQGLQLRASATPDELAMFTDLYRQGRPGSSEAVARRLVQKPLFHAGMLVRTGMADALLAGITCPTARVVEAGLMTVGLAPGIQTASSYFVMGLPGQPLLFADCALNVEPDCGQLADIAIASGQSYARIFNEPPRVALLSFSTQGSARGPQVEKVQQALKLVHARAPDLLADGELQLDAALNPEVAANKAGGDSEVAGKANVLVFPDLNSGNIAYKLARHLTGCQALGPILQGFAKPLGDLSRSASVDEIVLTAWLLLAQVENNS